MFRFMEFNKIICDWSVRFHIGNRIFIPLFGKEIFSEA